MTHRNRCSRCRCVHQGRYACCLPCRLSTRERNKARGDALWLRGLCLACKGRLDGPHVRCAACRRTHALAQRARAALKKEV